VNVTWYVARASGMVAWFFLAASVLWGLGVTTRILQDRRKPGWLLDLHRWLGGLALSFTVIHLIGLWFDEYVEFGLREFFVPFASEWRPKAIAWGVVAFYLLVAVQVTSLMQRKLPKEVWRGIHLTSFVMFFAAGIHAGLSGTDMTRGFYRWSTVTLIGLGMVAMLYRFLAGTVRAAAKKAREERDRVG